MIQRRILISIVQTKCLFRLVCSVVLKESSHLVTEGSKDISSTAEEIQSSNWSKISDSLGPYGRLQNVFLSISLQMCFRVFTVYQTQLNRRCCIFLPLAQQTGSSLGCVGWFLVILSSIFTIVLFPITIWFCVKVSELNNQHRCLKSRNCYFLCCLRECESRLFCGFPVAVADCSGV